MPEVHTKVGGGRGKSMFGQVTGEWEWEWEREGKKARGRGRGRGRTGTSYIVEVEEIEESRDADT
jgi:hypothetical protein